MSLQEELGIAREAFTKSWGIKPMAGTATEMIGVELGDSQGRAEMEKWFDRAMELDPANYDACNAKLFWLLPKWHGSIKDMQEFSRQCLTNVSWRGRVPLMPYEIHKSLAMHFEYAGKGTKESYWRTAGVWPEVKAAFERFFELNPGPDSVGWRHNYALAAYHARAWEDLRAQLKLLGPLNYDFFSGKAEFDKIVRQAEARR